MLKSLATPIAAALLLATPALAMARVELSDANTAHVRQVLKEQGYEVANVTIEKGYYEAYARKDGKRYEILLDGDFKIVAQD